MYVFFNGIFIISIKFVKSYKSNKLQFYYIAIMYKRNSKLLVISNLIDNKYKIIYFIQWNKFYFRKITKFSILSYKKLKKKLFREHFLNHILEIIKKS